MMSGKRFIRKQPWRTVQSELSMCESHLSSSAAEVISHVYSQSVGGWSRLSQRARSNHLSFSKNTYVVPAHKTYEFHPFLSPATNILEHMVLWRLVIRQRHFRMWLVYLWHVSDMTGWPAFWKRRKDGVWISYQKVLWLDVPVDDVKAV